MTKLTTLRAQLGNLRRARSLVRTSTACSALAIAALWSLTAVLLLDLVFELAAPQRIVVLLLAVGATVWAAWRFTLPLLGVKETDEDMALMVERQQQIDSDLVAALQFESSEAPAWGSVQLEGAVIDYVANVGSGLDVFEGFDRQQMVRRATILGVTASILLLAALLFPGYTRAFFNRLLLGGMHYPTATQIDRVLINHATVLLRDRHGSAPTDVKVAQGQPIAFLIACSGDLPASGEVQLVSSGGTRSKTTIGLQAVSLDDRLVRLKASEKQLRDALRSGDFQTSFAGQSTLLASLQFEAPEAAASLVAAEKAEDLQQAADAVANEIESWPGDRESTALYAGELPRLSDGVEYQLYLGDAWTDSAAIAMTPLPAVELRLTATPPPYAENGQAPEETGQRQLAVLEGSSVQLAIECTNKKPLASAWLLLKRPHGSQRFDLVQQDAASNRWELQSNQATPFDRVIEELRYEIQVEDADQLSLETPIQGVIRIKPDRPPTGSAELVHRVVLPTAEPIVHYRATDDFGLSALNMIVEIERPDPEGEFSTPAETEIGSLASDTAAAPSATESTAAERHVFRLLAGNEVRSSALPIQSTFAVPFSTLKLAKGDRVKLTLEVIDFRGLSKRDQPLGESYHSDPLVLEISDESGVLAAISEADERSEQRLTDIIKRQLGIGESP